MSDILSSHQLKNYTGDPVVAKARDAVNQNTYPLS